MVWSTGIRVDLEVVEVESRERNGRKGKKELKNYVFQFRMNMRKILIVVQNGPESYFGCSSKEKLKTDFAWPCENFAQSWKCSRKANLLLMRFPLRTIVRNCWSSFEIACFPDFLMKKPPEDLLDDAKCPLDLGL